jgi:hypothetical protein
MKRITKKIPNANIYCETMKKNEAALCQQSSELAFMVLTEVTLILKLF